MKTTTYRLWATASAFAMLAMTTPALAENAASPAPATPDDNGPTLKEIIVTATRSGETKLQNTPIAVTAFSNQALIDRGITSAIDLNGMAPNVSVGGRSGTGALSGAITIRGIGADANAPAQPGVGVYVDDVYIPSQFGNLLGTYDLAQLEVLRGPQGTTFGRNTIGGAVQYVGVKPNLDKWSAFAEATAGNQAHFDVSAGVNIPLASWAALRVSGARNDLGGYVHDLLNNLYRGTDLNTDGRVQLRLQPTSDLLIDLKIEQVTQKSNGPPAIQTGFGLTPLDEAPVPGFGNVLGLLNALYKSPNWYTTAGVNGPERFNSKLQIAQGVVAYTISPDIKLKATTAYSHTTDFLATDSDGTPLALFDSSRGNDLNKLFTEELQLAGKSLGGKLRWTLGVYYYSENNSDTDSCAEIGPSPCQDTTFGDYDVKTKSYAAYGQATFDITHELSVVGGLRYTSDHIDLIENLDPATPPVTAPFVYETGASKSKYTNWSPTLGANYQATSDILFYAKWSRGFRAGGFAPNLYSANAFGPETAETYEVGMRAEFLDRRVRINPTLFVTNWKNIQFNTSAVEGGIPLPIVTNAGDAHSQGAELETQFAVTRHFTITANGALFDGHYKNLLPAVTEAIFTAIPLLNYSDTLKRAPKSSFSVGGHYELPVGEGKFVLSGNYTWQAHQRSATSDTDSLEIAAYGLLTARLGYSSPNNRYNISIFANNLTNVHYAIGGTSWPLGGLIPDYEVDVGRPREFGVTGRVNF